MSGEWKAIYSAAKERSPGRGDAGGGECSGVHEDAHVAERQKDDDRVEPVKAAQLPPIGYDLARPLLSDVLIQGLAQPTIRSRPMVACCLVSRSEVPLDNTPSRSAARRHEVRLAHREATALELSARCAPAGTKGSSGQPYQSAGWARGWPAEVSSSAAVHSPYGSLARKERVRDVAAHRSSRSRARARRPAGEAGSSGQAMGVGSCAVGRSLPLPSPDSVSGSPNKPSPEVAASPSNSLLHSARLQRARVVGERVSAKNRVSDGHSVGRAFEQCRRLYALWEPEGRMQSVETLTLT